jgi:hypothetical protein
MLGDNIAVAEAPVMLKAHQADTPFAGKRRGFRQRKLAFRLDQPRFVDTAHGFGVATSRRFAAGFRRAERFHVNVADALFSEAGGEQMFGKAGAPRIGDLAHIHQCLHFRGFQCRDEIWDTDALVADGPDPAQCR